MNMQIYQSLTPKEKLFADLQLEIIDLLKTMIAQVNE